MKGLLFGALVVAVGVMIYSKAAKKFPALA